MKQASDYGFQSVAFFLRNQRQWNAEPLSQEAVESFKRERNQTGISVVVAHGSYLVNLAGAREIREKSIASVAEDLDRCGRLGIEYLVLHPGANKDLRIGIQTIAEGLRSIVSPCSHEGPMLLLETTAGQGNCIGHRFEHFSAILAQVDCPERFGVCLDTAHIFAAGYDLRTPDAYAKTMKHFDRVLGRERIQAIHCNDSLKPLGSRVDRHAHIGQGEIGLQGFAQLVNDPGFKETPFILETPKGLDTKGRDWDTLNARTLEALIAP